MQNRTLSMRVLLLTAIVVCTGTHVAHAQIAGCEAPVLEVDIFTAELAPDGTSSVVLSFDDPNPAGVATGYNIYRSANPTQPFSEWMRIASSVVDQNAAEPGIQWFESGGELPATGIWFYLATAFNEPCTQEGPWKSLRVGNTRDAGRCSRVAESARTVIRKNSAIWPAIGFGCSTVLRTRRLARP